MSHLSDKELDRLSREAAEQFDVEGSASGWDALEKSLDKELPLDGPKPKKRRGIWYWFTAALLLLGIPAAIYLLNDINNKVTTGDTIVTSEVEKSSSQQPSKLEGDELPGKTSKGSPVITESYSSTENQPTSSKDDRYTSSFQKDKTSISSYKDRRYINKRSSKTSSLDKSNNFLETEFSSTSNIPQLGNPEVELIRQPEPASIVHDNHAFFIPDSTRADSLIALLAAQTRECDTNVKSSTLFPWEIGMVLGVDKSNVNFNGGYKTGFNYGIYLGYRFSKRWSVNTGLVFDKKFYTAKGKDFHPPKGYWTDYVKLDKVSGNCTMWEVPVNIRYDLALTRKGFWFASAGLSTYLMQQEDYDYYYWQNGNYLNRHRGYPSDEKSIMGVLNFSAGFEKNFTPHVSLQIEPYMRIPLKGVGFGNMQMNSFGTNLILKFKGGKPIN